jgi:prophage regulatory protein
MNKIISTNQTLVRLPALLERTGMSRSWIYKEMAAGRFPAPAKIGGASAWRSADIDCWIENLFQPQRAPNRYAGRA